MYVSEYVLDPEIVKIPAESLMFPINSNLTKSLDIDLFKFYLNVNTKICSINSCQLNETYLLPTKNINNICCKHRGRTCHWHSLQADVEVCVSVVNMKAVTTGLV